jgi:hypothetical protein
MDLCDELLVSLICKHSSMMIKYCHVTYDQHSTLLKLIESQKEVMHTNTT